MAYRVANSLNVLLNQLNNMAPRRSKASDGAIGDPAHASRVSDHNPDRYGVVRARDYTHDPAGGLDCHWLADKLVRSGDARIKYIIWNRRIWQGSWSYYSGTNPHTQHLHLSVVADSRADQTHPWNLGVESIPAPAQEDPNVKNLIVAQEYGSTRTWVGDGIVRRHIQDPTELSGIQFWIARKGGDATVNKGWRDLRVLGHDINEMTEVWHLLATGHKQDGRYNRDLANIAGQIQAVGKAVEDLATKVAALEQRLSSS